MTNLEYIQSVLPEPFWQAIVRNTIAQRKEKRLSDGSRGKRTVQDLFTWGTSTEGYSFWESVHLFVNEMSSQLPEPQSFWSEHAPQKLSAHDGSEKPNQGHKPQNKTMLHKYADKPVATPTLVNGQDVTDLSDREILNQIKARKKSVEEIVATGAVGAYVDHFSTQEGIAIEALLKELNNRAPQPAAAPEA